MELAASLPTAPAAKDADVRELERLFFQHSQDGMVLVGVERKPDGNPRFRILAENPAAAGRLDAIGQDKAWKERDLESALPAWLGRKLHLHYEACVSSREVRRYEIVQPNGGLTHESIATPVQNADGEVAYIVVTMRDIADRVLQERKLNQALARAEDAKRSKAEFFASMSHELRTPLNAILGFSEMMEKGIGGGLSHTHMEYVDYIRSSGTNLMNIISDILTLSKMEAGQFKLQEIETAIAPLVETAVQMVRERALRKNLKIQMETAADIPNILVDPVRIKQILLNLLSNAIKFTEQGVVTVSAGYDAATGFTFAVSDTGIGMSAEELQTALQPFGQVEDAYVRNTDGTGMGLPIAKHLAELHGGTLTLSSRKSEGTRVLVTLPASRALPARQSGAAAAG